ncbi:MAG: DUF523 domain-containing protein [Clostridiales bacterium]|nr:DUF523 domain-containing protein [Clostridiales bacterium]
MHILVSACLLGLHTRYDGKHNQRDNLIKLGERHVLIPVCPEQLGGLPTPRVPCERVYHQVISKDGADCTAAFELGANEALKVFELCGCEAAILKARSPSCGKGPTYDGSFTGKLTDRPGMFAEKLIKMGIPVYNEDELHLLV